MELYQLIRKGFVSQLNDRMYGQRVIAVVWAKNVQDAQRYFSSLGWKEHKLRTIRKVEMASARG